MANLQKIKEIARQKNISLDVLAKEIGVTPQALSKMMRNNSTKIDTIERIAEILKVSVTTFFEDNQITSPVVVGDNNQFAGRDIAQGQEFGKMVDTICSQQQSIADLIRQQGRFLDIFNTPSAK